MHLHGNKDRLYVTLYARGGQPKMPGLEDTYHWAFIVGPKEERKEGARGKRFHAKEIIANRQSVWKYEARGTTLGPTSMLLVRILIGKVADLDRLVAVFENTPIRGGQPGYDKWNCVAWIQEALESAQRDGKALGASVTDWGSVRDTAMWYVAKKKNEHRFDGQAHFDQSKAPTWDILEKRETIP